MKMRTKRFEKPICASALALSSLAIALPATAQQAQTSDELTEIVVTGIRASLQSAQEIKKNSDQIVDSVTATDIGALPDRSVSEALQRIPGVTLQRTNENRDPARLASEGGGVFIRGLSWVRSETNGRDIFSANSGRNLSFEDVSADLLAGVDVYKNPSAELIEGGIGGIVNLRTRLPFDSDKRQFAVSADYNYADLKEEGFVSGNALYSNRWETGAGEFGALLSVSIGNIGNRTDSIQAGRFEPRDRDDDGNGTTDRTVYIPNSFGWRRIDWEQKRSAVAAAFQYAPTDTVTMTLQGLYAKATPKDIEHAFGDVEGNYNPNSASYEFDDDGVIQSGTLSNAKLTANTRYGESTKETSDYSFNIKYEPNETWAFSFDVQRVESHADVLSMTAFSQLGSCNDSANACSLDFDLAGDTPGLAFHQANNQSAVASVYWWAAAMDHIEDNDADSTAVRADAEMLFDDDSVFKSFRFGVRATEKGALTRQSGWNWGLLSNQFWGSDGRPVVNLNNPVGGLNTQTTLFTYDNFFRGDIGVPTGGWFPSDGLVSNGTQAANDYLRSAQSGSWGWAPLSTDYSLANPGGDNPNAGINDQSEATRAAYAMIRFGNEEGGKGHWDANLGVRAVKTDEDAIGVLRINAPQNTMSPAACIAANGAAACQPLINALLFAAGGNQPGFAQSNSYTDWLPSLNVRFFLRDDLQLRFAAAEAMVRPTFSQMMPYTSLSYTFETDGFTPDDISPVTGSGGNPNLKPTKSTQFDASLEWYFAPTGSLTFATFFKDIKDYIFLGQDTETYTSNGITQDFEVTRNMNGSKGKIKGFEVGYQQFYDGLPGWASGFGLQANFTFVDSSGGKNTAINILEPAQVAGAEDSTLPLEGLSETSYNIAGMYEKYGVSARLAYNWRERFLLTTSAANIQRPVWSEDYGQLDGSVFYSITDNIKVGLQGTNLLNSRTYLDVGGATLAPRYSWTDTDRRIALAVRASF
jgi:TonB-dependent receptor